MQALATMTVQDHASVDSVIVWNDGERNIAYAYKDAKVVMRYVLSGAGQTLAQDLAEAVDAWNITDRHVVSVTQWGQDIDRLAVAPAPAPRRWV